MDDLRKLLPENLAGNVLSGLSLSDTDLDRLQSRAAADGLEFQKPSALCVTSWERAVAAMLDVRMLFSCLVDADFLDTEAHFNGDANGKRPRPAGPRLDAQEAVAAFGTRVCGKDRSAKESKFENLRERHTEVQNSCSGPTKKNRLRQTYGG